MICQILIYMGFLPVSYNLSAAVKSQKAPYTKIGHGLGVGYISIQSVSSLPKRVCTGQTGVVNEWFREGLQHNRTW